MAALRELLAPTGWLERTRRLGKALRGCTRSPGGLLVVGTPGEDPWHVTAHLEDEARLGGDAGPDADPDPLVTAARRAGAPADRPGAAGGGAARRDAVRRGRGGRAGSAA